MGEIVAVAMPAAEGDAVGAAEALYEHVIEKRAKNEAKIAEYEKNQQMEKKK